MRRAVEDTGETLNLNMRVYLDARRTTRNRLFAALLPARARLPTRPCPAIDLTY